VSKTQSADFIIQKCSEILKFLIKALKRAKERKNLKKTAKKKLQLDFLRV
jgi:hypothetical protein